MAFEPVSRFIESLVTWPTLPASVVMLLIILYGGLVVLGAVDLDLFDFDLDSDGVEGIGFVTLKFLNIGDVPLMIWVSAFAFLWWVVSIFFGMIIDRPVGDEGGVVVQQVIRNLVISVLLTKAATEPLEIVFAKQLTRHPEDLIGLECDISTYVATPEEGQARFPTEAAPLLLNVRTAGEALRQGDTARIIDYDPATRIYLVAAVAPDV